MIQDSIYYISIAGGIVAVLSIFMYVFIKSPMLLLGDDFLNMFSVQRTLYIAGRKGGGKTLLAFFLSAVIYVKGQVKYIYANVPSVLCDRVSLPLEDCVFIVDECQDFISDAKSAKEAEAFIRKLRLRFIMAGVGAPHRTFTKLKCWRVFNGFRIFLPIWVYRWRWEGIQEVEQGMFFLLRPDLCFFFYDTQDIPPDDGGLFDALGKTVALHKMIAQERIDLETAQQAIEVSNDQTDDNREGDTEETEDSNPTQDKGGIGEFTASEGITESLASFTEDFEDTQTKISLAIERLGKHLKRK